MDTVKSAASFVLPEMRLITAENISRKSLQLQRFLVYRGSGYFQREIHTTFSFTFYASAQGFLCIHCHNTPHPIQTWLIALQPSMKFKLLVYEQKILSVQLQLVT